MGAWGACLLWIARNVSRRGRGALEEECSRTRRQKVLETRIVRGFDILAEGHARGERKKKREKRKRKRKRKGERISSALVRAFRRLDERMKKIEFVFLSW